MSVANETKPFTGIQGIFHLNIPVRSMEESKKFYGDLLGLPEVQKRKNSVNRGDGQIRTDYEFYGNHIILHEVSGEEGEAQLSSAHNVMLRHMGVFLPWPEFKAVIERLDKAGFGYRLHGADASALKSDDAPEELGTMIQDPSGNSIEFKTSKDIVEWLNREK
jgi:extradiol dioxygenase family protein